MGPWLRGCAGFRGVSCSSERRQELCAPNNSEAGGGVLGRRGPERIRDRNPMKAEKLHQSEIRIRQCDFAAEWKREATAQQLSSSDHSQLHRCALLGGVQRWMGGSNIPRQAANESRRKGPRIHLQKLKRRITILVGCWHEKGPTGLFSGRFSSSSKPSEKDLTSATLDIKFSPNPAREYPTSRQSAGMILGPCHRFHPMLVPVSGCSGLPAIISSCASSLRFRASQARPYSM